MRILSLGRALHTALIVTLLPALAFAADITWTNPIPGSFFNALNWSPNTVPGAADNARFAGNIFPTISWSASRTNANALLNNSSGGFQANIGTNFWLLTNSLVVGQNAGLASALFHVTGRLLVTNAAGTAQLMVGQNGRGTYLMQTPAATSVVDRLIATNVNPFVFTNSTVLFQAGSLTILEGSHVRTPHSDFLVGTTTNQPVVLNFFGGMNIFDTGIGDTVLGAGSNIVSLVTVSGVGTLWTNSTDLIIGDYGKSSWLAITNGGAVWNTSGYIGNESGASSNTVMVGGPGSLWTNRFNLRVGYSGTCNSLLITNGGTVKSWFGSVGSAQDATSNTVTISGIGSLWTNRESLTVGDQGSGNALLISNGGTVWNNTGYIGLGSGASSNTVMVSGAGSLWANGDLLRVGNAGSFNTLFITNGGTVQSLAGFVGDLSSAMSNTVVVSGAGSLWTNYSGVQVGRDGSHNILLITNGGTVRSAFGSIGHPTQHTFDPSNNIVMVRGAGSLWACRDDLSIAGQGQGNSNALIIADGGTVSADEVRIGGTLFDPEGNSLTVAGGTLRATNTTHTAALRLQRGVAVLDLGQIEVSQLLLTDFSVTSGGFRFHRGSLSTRFADVASQRRFVVGNGTNVATYFMNGTDTNLHKFDSGLLLSSNATLTGNGTVQGLLTASPGATVAPGTSAGRLNLTQPPQLGGSFLMEISKTGSTLTNDVVALSSGTLTYGGKIVVINVGSDALVLGDSFQLFSAPAYAGNFQSITLPPLPPGLGWTNRLAVNGSIQVVSVVPLRISSAVQAGTNLVLSASGGTPDGGWDLLNSTNVALPVAQWPTNRSGLFDLMGNVVLTNTINPSEPKRFFLLQQQ